MSPAEEQRLKGALVRICDAEGRTWGTGFFASAQGDVVTCFHVVEPLLDREPGPGGKGPLFIGDSHGTLLAARLGRAASCLPQDIAVLRTEARPPCVLPLAGAFEIGREVWTAGFHFHNLGIRDSFPVATRISGTTTIEIQQQEKSLILASVLTLATPFIDSGLSGAPLLDAETSVVIGIVTAKFRTDGGFAIALATAVGNCAKGFADFIAGNASAVPRFGKYLNAEGARALCHQQCTKAVQRLIDTRQYLPDMYVARPEKEIVETFLNSPKKILAIAGHSGVGKTSLLAELASTVRSRPVVLLNSATGHFDKSGLQTTLHEEIKTVTELPSLDVSEALFADAQELFVLVDAINETDLLEKDAAALWIQNTCVWLAKHPVRLVVTSRPEYWALIEEFFFPDMLYRGREQETVGAKIPEFKEEDARAAFHAYGLEGRIPWAPLLRHPLFLRMASEIANEDGQHPEKPQRLINDYTVLQRYVSLVSRRVARVPGAMASAPEVEAILASLAARIRSAGSLIIPRETAAAVFAGSAPVRIALLKENVLLEARDSYRFTFDQVAEFLLASADDAEDFSSDRAIENSFSESQQHLLGVLRLKVLALECAGAHERLADVLRQLAVKSYSGERGSVFIEFVIHTFDSLSTSADYLPAYKTLVDRWHEAARREERGYYVAAMDIAESLRRAFTTVSELYGMLRKLMTVERSRGWREKDWRVQTRPEFSREVLRFHGAYTPARLLIESFQEQPLACAEELIGWLEDRSGLTDLHYGDGEARIVDIAMAVLFHFRQGIFHQICDLLPNAYRGRRLLELFAEWEPAAMATQLIFWFDEQRTENHRKAAVLADTVLQSRRAVFDQKELLLRLASIAKESKDTDVVALALIALSRSHEMSDAILSDLLKLFDSGSPVIESWAMGSYLESHPDIVLGHFDRALASCTDEQRRKDIVSVLGSQPARSHPALIIPRLRKYWDQYPELRTRIVAALEGQSYDLSNNSPSSNVYDEALDLAFLIASEASREGHSALILFATYYNEDAVQNRRRFDLVMRLINNSDTHNLIFIMQQLCEEWGDHAQCMELCLAAANRLDRRNFEKEFLWAMKGNPPLLQWFQGWWARERTTCAKYFPALSKWESKYDILTRAIEAIASS